MVAETSLRDRRSRLLAEPGLRGQEFCRRYAAEADAWLSGLAERAAGDVNRHLALVAVGGYGRGSLCPYSDLDVVLVHNGHRDIGKVADAIWYPVWDQGVHLDHSVRRPSEVLSAAAEDVRVALGLLDGRLVWGEAKVAEPLLEKARAAWRDRLGARYLPLLQQQMAERRATAGDVAFLLEPDLKESHGGLRDVSVLRAISAFAPLLADYADLDSLNGATALLTDIRVELHRLAQREHDKLLLQDQDQVAAALGFVDADALMLAVSTAGRQIAWVSDDVWRRRRLWDPTPPPKRRFRRHAVRPRHGPRAGRSRARHGRGRRGNRLDVARPGLRRHLAALAPCRHRSRARTGPSPRGRCTGWPTACHRRATHGRTRPALRSSRCWPWADPPSTRSSRSISTVS